MTPDINKLLERLRTYYGDDLACRMLLMDARHALEAMAGEVERLQGAMPTDIKQLRGTERLIRLDCLFDGKPGCVCSHCEASDTIARLATERDRLKAALQQIASQKTFAELEAEAEDDDYDLIGAWDIVIGVARKALGGDT